jgi:uncharacterized membrane protein
MPLWIIPLVYVIASVVAGLVLPPLEYAYFSDYDRGLAVSTAQALLAAIASGMMSLTAIVFAIAFLIVQFSASAYSKRMILLFGRDPVLFNTLGLFIGTFIYALATLSYVDREQNGSVPFFSTALVGLLLAASMVLLGMLVHRLSELQITRVLQIVGKKGRQVVRATLPRIDGQSGDEIVALRKQAEAARAGAPTQTLQYHGAPQAVTRFDVAALVRQATAAQGVIVMECAVGDTLAEGTTLLRVYSANAPISSATLLKAIGFARERTFDRDPKYSLRLLVDTAIMALSPAVNDPTTAVQAIDQIADLLYHVGRRVLDAGFAGDANGVLRLTFPMPTWEDYLSLAFDEIRLYGADSLQVVRRLRAAFVDLERSLDREDRADRAAAVRRFAEHLDQGIEHSAFDDLDRAAARQGDPQGLGQTRREAPG